MKEGMRMPGFTADASLYKPRRHYSLGVSMSADGQAITPQGPLSAPDGCFWVSYWDRYYGRSRWKLVCYTE